MAWKPTHMTAPRAAMISTAMAVYR
jgi:hypothetical protein